MMMQVMLKLQQAGTATLRKAATHTSVDDYGASMERIIVIADYLIGLQQASIGHIRFGQQAHVIDIESCLSILYPI